MPDSTNSKATLHYWELAQKMANNQETLKFRITLEPEYWNQPPEFQVLVDGVPIELAPVQLHSGVATVIEFENQLIDGDHTIGVRL
jgi:hypothetical protein